MVRGVFCSLHLLVSWGCQNKGSPAGWLTTATMYPLGSGEEVQSQGVSTAMLPETLPWTRLPRLLWLLVAPSVPWLVAASLQFLCLWPQRVTYILLVHTLAIKERANSLYWARGESTPMLMLSLPQRPLSLVFLPTLPGQALPGTT